MRDSTQNEHCTSAEQGHSFPRPSKRSVDVDAQTPPKRRKLERIGFRRPASSSPARKHRLQLSNLNNIKSNLSSPTRGPPNPENFWASWSSREDPRTSCENRLLERRQSQEGNNTENDQPGNSHSHKDPPVPIDGGSFQYSTYGTDPESGDIRLGSSAVAAIGLESNLSPDEYSCGFGDLFTPDGSLSSVSEKSSLVHEGYDPPNTPEMLARIPDAWLASPFRVDLETAAASLDCIADLFTWSGPHLDAHGELRIVVEQVIHCFNGIRSGGELDMRKFRKTLYKHPNSARWLRPNACRWLYKSFREPEFAMLNGINTAVL